MLPHYAWNETVIKDMLGVDIQEISDVVVLSPVECMVYSGQHSRGQGFTQTEATEIARQLHDSHTIWIGRRVRMCCILRTLRDAKLDLRSAKEYIRECTYGKLGTRSPTRRSGNKEAHRQAVSPWDASRGRGMVRRSDRYLADQYLRRERREGRAHATWPEESDPQDAMTAWVKHYAEAPEARIGTGAGTDRQRAGVGRGYPLGQGRPEDIPQSVTDAFHSTQEDQWTHCLSPCLMIATRSRMTLWRTTPLRPDIPPGLNGTGEKEETTAWLTEGIVGRDAMARTDVVRS